MMEATLRIFGLIVGLGLIAISVWMLLVPIGADGWWQTFGKVSNALLGAVFVLYGLLGRARFSGVLPTAGRKLGE
ncbi:MAG: hypothetical protein D6712_09075 [Chloroflexi bacterium]|nr:MAG: hypothetical protein D6712_09075 [Chloroflexota bacterium]